MALAIFTQNWKRDGHGTVHPLEILEQPLLIGWIIDEANRLAEIIEKTGILSRKPVPLIKIKLRRG
jgi:hypothetical protein